MKQELLLNITDTIAITPYINNRPAISTSATVTIKGPGGTTLVAAGTTAVVNATTGEITYDFNLSINTALGENFVCDFKYIISSITYYQTVLFDVVLNRLAISVIDEDLLNEQSDILGRNEGIGDVVSSSTSTTLVALNLKTYADDYWNGGVIEASDPATGVIQKRVVTDFVKSTGTITVDAAWATNPTSSYNFTLRRGFQKKIDQSFNEMMLDVNARGYRPALILESSDLKVPLIKKSLALICRDFSKEVDDKWWALSESYEKQYDAMFSKVKFQYDANQSGGIGGEDEQNRDAGSVRLLR